MTTQITTGTKTRLLPHDIEAEESVLGSFLIDSSCVKKVINKINQSDFYSERTGKIYKACYDLFLRKEIINTVTLAQELDRNQLLESIGGVPFLSHLSSVTPTSFDVESYADIVYRCSVSRKAINLAKQIAEIGFSNNPTSSNSIQKIYELASDFKKSNDVNDNKLITPVIAADDIMHLLHEYNNQTKNKMSWGYYDLDNITAGIYPEYYIFGARPSVGKTQLMLDIAENVAMQGYKVLFVSAEMAKEQLYERKLARKIETSILEIRKRGLHEHEEKALLELVGEISESSMSYLAGGIYLKDIYREVSILKEKGAIDIVFIDYLGALRDCYGEKDNQTVRISRVSNKIQDMTHEFNLPFMVAAQLNREVEHRESVNKNNSIKTKPPFIYFLYTLSLPHFTLTFKFWISLFI
jgi:replicative DNA helicase